MVGPKKYEVTGEWRKLHNENLKNLYYPADNVLMTKSRRMRWVGRGVCMVEQRGCGNLKVRDHFGDPGLGGEENIKLNL
jgi:hypothetical protein